MRRAHSDHLRRITAAATLAVLTSCGPAADSTPSRNLDAAVERYVAGEYRSAIAELERVVASSSDDEVRREAYTYMGRAHMALGETDDAISAFTLGARYGDRGVCIAYLETLKQYTGGAPASLHISPALTRAQLAIAVVRFMDPEGATGGSLGVNAPTPLRRLENRGWMAPLADGDDHMDDPVTPAALYTMAARMLAEMNLADRIGEVMPGGYRVALDQESAVSGAQALAVLERIRRLKEEHGR